MFTYLYAVLGYVCITLSMCVLRCYAWYCRLVTCIGYRHASAAPKCNVKN